MDEVTPLDRLIEAVEAGQSWPHELAAKWLWIHPGQVYGWVKDAYHGSLDAALALHEALLPYMGYELTGGGLDDYCCTITRFEDNDVTTWGIWGYTPARAWLIAILHAYRDTKGGDA